VPLDPGYPAERLKYMLSDSAPVAVLSHAPARALLEVALEGQLPALPIIDLDTHVSLWSQGSG
jgi:non-ribosomal peptide synthetase component F